MENIDALRQEIERRLQRSEKASAISREIGISRDQIQKIAHKAGIKLKQGRLKICDNLELYRQHIDDKYGPGTADKILLLREHLTYADIGKELGIDQRGSVHHIAKHLTGGERKPKIPHKPENWLRPDITIEIIRNLAEQCLSVREIEKKLSVTRTTIFQRAKLGNIKLPDGNKNIKRILISKVRPDISQEKIQKLSKDLPSISAIARALNTDVATIKRRAKRFRITLPNHLDSLRTRREQNCEHIVQRLLEMPEIKRNVTLIAASIGVDRSTLYKYNKMFCLGIPVVQHTKHKVA